MWLHLFPTEGKISGPPENTCTECDERTALCRLSCSLMKTETLFQEYDTNRKRWGQIKGSMTEWTQSELRGDSHSWGMIINIIFWFLRIGFTVEQMQWSLTVCPSFLLSLVQSSCFVHPLPFIYASTVWAEINAQFWFCVSSHHSFLSGQYQILVVHWLNPKNKDVPLYRRSQSVPEMLVSVRRKQAEWRFPVGRCSVVAVGGSLVDHWWITGGSPLSLGRLRLRRHLSFFCRRTLTSRVSALGQSLKDGK